MNLQKLAIVGKQEIKPLVGKLAEKGVGSVDEFLDFVKNPENSKQFSEKELIFLGDLQKCCEKISKKFKEKFENCYSIVY